MIAILIFTESYMESKNKCASIPNDSVELPRCGFSEKSALLDVVDSLMETRFLEHKYYIISFAQANELFFQIEDSGTPNSVIESILYGRGFYGKIPTKCFIGCIEYRNRVFVVININVDENKIRCFITKEERTFYLSWQEDPLLYDLSDNKWFVYHHPLYFMWNNNKFIHARAILGTN